MVIRLMSLAYHRRSATQKCVFPTDAQILQSVTKTSNNGRRMLEMTSAAPWATLNDPEGDEPADIQVETWFTIDWHRMDVFACTRPELSNPPQTSIPISPWEARLAFWYRVSFETRLSMGSSDDNGSRLLVCCRESILRQRSATLFGADMQTAECPRSLRGAFHARLLLRNLPPLLSTAAGPRSSFPRPTIASATPSARCAPLHDILRGLSKWFFFSLSVVCCSKDMLMRFLLSMTARY